MRTSGKFNAVVPGTVLTTLVARGVYPDPYFGVNNLSIPDSLCRMDWWYTAELPLDTGRLAGKKIELLFNGINYKADVWVNGIKAGSMAGAFVRGRFDITSLVKEQNLIAVHIFPPHNPGIPHEQSSTAGRGPNGGQLCLDGPTFISSEGWDWIPGIRDRNIGLWQDVELVISEGVLLGDTHIITDLPLPATDYADVYVKTTIKTSAHSFAKTFSCTSAHPSAEIISEIPAHTSAQASVSTSVKAGFPTEVTVSAEVMELAPSFASISSITPLSSSSPSSSSSSIPPSSSNLPSSSSTSSAFSPMSVAPGQYELPGGYGRVCLQKKCNFRLEAGDNELEFSFRMENPRLWMPNGYGEPHLYVLKLSVFEGSKLLDCQNIRFGVRELSYELSVDTPTRQNLRIEYSPTDLRSYGALFDNRLQRRVEGETEIPSLRQEVDENILKVIPRDEMGPYLVIKVNGVRIFCRGGNWGMDDGMKDCSRDKLEPYLQLHRDAGFNMIRNWTGESTEEMFYTLCDEYGMLVWNDFWMSTEGYNLDPNDEDLFMANAVDVLKRFRNHPSIALWCPRNEGYATEGLERRLDDAVAHYDGSRRYHPNSRYSNLRSSGPWHYIADPAEYFESRAFGFNTEIGAPSFPTAETMRRFFAPEDQWPVSEAWHYHDMHFETEPYMEDMTSKYGAAESLDDFCRKSQMMNYDSYRAMIESWNSRMWANTSGVLLWMSHPAWPSVEWQSYSYDCETMASYFGCKKACEPVHIQMNADDMDVVVLNTTLKELRGLDAEMKIYSLDGKILSSRISSLPVASANSQTECFRADLSAAEGVYIVRLLLKDANGNVLSRNDYLRSSDGSFKAMDTEKISLRARRQKDGSVVVSNPSKYTAIGIKLNARYLSDGSPVLPAFFSDGYFNLLPGESRTISVSYTARAGSSIYISADGFNVAPGPVCR